MTTVLGPPAETEEGIGALTFGGLLEEVAAKYAEREAVVFHAEDGVVRWTYDDLRRESRRIARALLAGGVVKGTRVALLMGNRPEFVSSAFGVAMAGGVLIPISTFVAPPELEYILRHCDASVLLMEDRLLTHSYVDDLTVLCPEVVDAAPASLRTPRFPFLRTIVSTGITEATGAIEPWTAFVARADEISDELLDACEVEVSPADDGIIIYTSGTTARPKGVLHAQRTSALQSWRLARHICLQPDTRMWSPYPFCWTAGFGMVMGATIAAGGCLVLQEVFEAGEALRLIEEERVTTPIAKAHQHAQLEDHPDWATRDFSAIRDVEAFTSFGRHPTVHVDDRWSNRNAYGLTETMASFSSLVADAAPDERPGGHYGPILPGNALRVLDPTTGEPLPVGETGEFAVKGRTLAKGYVKVPPEDIFDADGYFHTGDSGFVDEQGRLHFTGRATQMIKTGGANVSPLEIEQELVHHPDVRMAWVVGVPDEQRGEVVTVCVVRHDGTTLTEDDVREFLRGKVASYKIPRHVLFFDVDEMALTSNNTKPKLDILRALVVERLTQPA